MYSFYVKHDSELVNNILTFLEKCSLAELSGRLKLSSVQTSNTRSTHYENNDVAKAILDAKAGTAQMILLLIKASVFAVNKPQLQCYTCQSTVISTCQPMVPQLK